MPLKITIRNKILGLGLLGLGFVLCVGTAGLLAASKLSTASDHITSIGAALKQQMLADMMHDALRGDVLRAMLNIAKHDPTEASAIKNELAEHTSTIVGAIQTISAMPIDTASSQALAHIKPNLDAYVKSAANVIRLAETSPPEAEVAMPIFQAAFNTLEKDMAALDDLLEASARTIQAGAAETNNTARLTIILTTLLSGVTLLAVGMVITRSVLRPISEAVKIAEAVAKGDLTSIVRDTASDETGQLMRSLKVMNDNLSSIVATVRTSGENIATGTSEIASGNADLSHRTESQASSLQATASSMAQLSGTVSTNADTARHATQLAHSASEVATKGGAIVDRVVNTMADISQSSKRISDIIGVIDGIAFQTNILALNAAVEAARAGEQGRGFAVVAAEVRSLAQRSANAAKEIKTLISASVEKVQTGSALVDDAGRTMDEIVNQVKHVADLIAEIGTATHQQTSGIAQVSQSVDQLDEVTQQNAALVEQSAAASESLRLQADRLLDSVSVFRLA